MKSENAKHFLHLDVLQGLFQDIVDLYPSERKNCERDYRRILRNFEHRGLTSLIVDLASIDDAIISLLRDGEITAQPSKDYFFCRSGEPVFLRGLWKLVLDKNGKLRSDADPNAIFFIRTISSFFKKADIPHSLKKEMEKIDEFRIIERDLSPLGTDWDISSDRYNVDTTGICRYAGSFFSERNEGDLLLLETCQRVADHLSELIESEYLSSTNLGQLSKSGFKNGNGAVAEGTRRIDKYNIPYANPSLYDNAPSIFPYENTNIMLDGVKPKLISSRLIAVPKDGRGPRLIAAEPSINMYFQQGLLSFFAKNVFKHTILKNFVNLQDQHLSKAMAKRGSIDGSLATIDLSSASDRLSCDLVHSFLRKAPSLRKALFVCRTQSVNINGDVVKLAKFATQGSAVTFPLQCLVFTIIALGSHIATSSMNAPISDCIRTLARRNVIRVFGDDIIVPNISAENTIHTLQLCHLRVNVKKTCYTGYFRESCGGDYFKGFDITPSKMRVAYVTEKPIHVQALLDFSNNLFLKGLWKASDACLRLAYYYDSRCRIQSFNMIGQDGPGLVTCSGRSFHRLTRRWNSTMHYQEYRSWTTSTRNVGASARPLAAWYKHAILEDGLSPSYSPLYGAVPRINAGLRWLTLQ